MQSLQAALPVAAAEVGPYSMHSCSIRKESITNNDLDMMLHWNLVKLPSNVPKIVEDNKDVSRTGWSLNQAATNRKGLDRSR
jgi:hypothetical protein